MIKHMLNFYRRARRGYQFRSDPQRHLRATRREAVRLAWINRGGRAGF